MSRSLLASLVFVFTTSALHAENWTAWRGPQGNGISTEKGLPSQWGENKNIAWKLAMPGIGGIEATRQICESSDAAVVVLTTFGESERVLAALDAGAVGYLLKDSQPARLIAGIRSAATGGSPLDPRVARALIDARQARPTSSPRLTDKQQEVLDLVARGLSNRLIARQLGISEKTVKAHLTTIYSTLGVTDRLQAALWATQGQVER